MLKRIVFIAWACMAVAAAHAQTTMAKMWTSMPDSLAPAYLKADKRRAMVDYYEMGETAEVTHELQGTSVMDTLSTQYARVTLSGAQSVQLALLPTTQGDTLLCRVVTFSAPASESRVDFFDTNWKRLDAERFLPAVSCSSLLHRPDSLSEEEFAVLCSFFEPKMMQVGLDPADFSLTFSLATPLTSRFDRERLEAVMVQRKVKWTGEMYK